MSDVSVTLTGPPAHTGEPILPGWLRLARAARSALFVLIYLGYLVFFMGLIQRAIIVPLTWLFPSRRDRIMGPWVRLQANNTLGLLHTIAGVRITIEGAIRPESAVIIMNHQSLLDIPIGFSVVSGPLPLIPTRRVYARGIPGVSVFVRHARLPLVSQTRKGRAADLAMISDAAERSRRGETSFFIFPEGHRTPDGEILPFMPAGLRIALTRVRRPIYCIVGDGMWHVRTLADTIVRVAGSRIHVRILGPFGPPPAGEIPEFIDFLRGRMIATLHEIRAGAPTPTPAPPGGRQDAV